MDIFLAQALGAADDTRDGGSFPFFTIKLECTGLAIDNGQKDSFFSASSPWIYEIYRSFTMPSKVQCIG